jgi:hypothetical protein
MKFRILAPFLAIAVATGAAQAQAKYLPESNNAALRYWAALVEMRDNPYAEEATEKMLSAVMRGETAWNEEKMGPVLDVYAGPIQTMQRGTKLPDCNWGLDYQLGNLNIKQTLMRSRGLEEVNTVEGVRQLAKGDSKAAVETWRAGIRFAQDLGRSGPVINAMVASALLMDELHAVANYAGPGKLPEAQREELYAAVKAMPEDGFDWGLAWGVEYAIGEQFLQQLRTSSNPKAVYENYGVSAPKGLPPTTEEIRAYEEYMLAAQAALRKPIAEARARADDLESTKRRLGEPEQLLAPAFRLTNDARVRVATQREELMRALASK